MTWGDEDWAREYLEKHKNDLTFRLMERLSDRWIDIIALALLVLLVVCLITLHWALSELGL